MSANAPEGVLSTGECCCSCRRGMLSLVRRRPGGACLSFGSVQSLRLSRQSWPEHVVHLIARTAWLCQCAQRCWPDGLQKCSHSCR